jgi:N-acetylneuraminic acid mutarotase
MKMTMKTNNKINGYILRRSAAALLFSCVVVALCSAINLPEQPPKALPPQDNAAFGVNEHESAASVAGSAIQRNRTLTFADRVAYQRAIEEVYWRHRIWPKANPGPKPQLDKVMSQAQIQKKVEDYLRDSQALEDYWQRSITADQLQAEMERMASHTKQPGALREIFAALGNDPFVIAECLARPVLAERLVTELYAHDQRFHGELKRRAEAELQTHRSVRQMKETLPAAASGSDAGAASGMYTEMEWIKSDAAKTGSAPADTRNIDAVKMNGGKWQERVQKLAIEFGVAAADDYGTLPVGVLSPLQEDNEHYYAVAVMKKGKDRLKLATVAWLKEPLRSWVTRAEAQVPMTMAAANSANYTLPVIASPSGSCTDDTWTPTSITNAPAERYWHTAVWTGSEMIVWGGVTSVQSFLNTGGRYNPSTDSWTATSITNAPAGRFHHTAVWTGSEMIVWGGSPAGTFFNTGGRYNPGTDSWTATSTINAPAGRYVHTAVWTGNEIIVWGGFGFGVGSDYLNTGGRYNPSTDSWTATTTTNAPAARDFHTAVWTGSQMIVWGGTNSLILNTGGRYNPSTDSWTATTTTGVPAGRAAHTAVWTGSQMIVWGGVRSSDYLNTGGRYNPSTDSWTATTTNNAPAARDFHAAVWTGSQMIVWGGYSGSYLNTGGRYNPSTDSWTATSITNAPAGRFQHTAVWTDTQMIVWGGRSGSDVNSGGRYCTATPGPITLSAVGRKVTGINTVRLTWSGATSTNIDVYRDAVVIVTTPNDGSYIDSTGDTGRARYTYKVCEAGTMNCSNEVTVRFRQ